MTEYAAYQQQRGVFGDIVDEAVKAYDEWLADDDFDAHGALRRIMGRMIERRALYCSPPDHSPGDNCAAGSGQLAGQLRDEPPPPHPPQVSQEFRED